ncbi:MAG: glycosyltransferase family 39 protein, partial [Candidatus Margulisbacteria bacterium]|nr:glycosyltransferase family 39 protein [Candidatus Margulisiibacteriota bacterium]
MYFNMFLAAFLVLINLFKIGVAQYFPLIGDEAYYWLWSQRLDLSYIAHPPMVAYVNFIATGLFGNNAFIIRLVAITIVLLLSWIIYRTGKELYGPGAATTAVIIFNLLPTFFGGGMFLVPQTILFLFWALSFYVFVLIIKHKNPHYWYLLGITAGLGLLSDYIM